MRLLATITLITVASSGAIHRTTGIAERTGVRIVFRTVFAIGKRCAISGKRRIVGYKYTVGGLAIWVRATWALTFAWLAISTVTTATATAIATRAAGTILLLAVRAFRVRARICESCSVCAWC